MKKVVVGISGGVDSSVAAYLLKEQGYEVIALFMINWHDTEGTLNGDCPWEDDVIFARLVARKLDIPFHTVDFSEQYRKRVVDYMFSEYGKGRTPNPDVLCNREIKFDLFAKAAEELGADYIATGHYCRKDEILVEGQEVYRLLAGIDKNKDQSYFLCQLSQEQLKTAMFPIGHLQKDEVRKIAEENGLVTANKKDSQGICFVGKVDLPVFLQQKLAAKQGEIIEIPVNYEKYTMEGKTGFPAVAGKYNYARLDGRNVGNHQGAHFFTIGQRKGLNVGGTLKPLYVIDTDIEHNIVYVGQGDDHPGLYRKGLFIPNDEIHWIRSDLSLETGEKSLMRARIRYRQPLQECELIKCAEGLYIIFDNPQKGVTPGQFAAWYKGDELIGSGVICEPNSC